MSYSQFCLIMQECINADSSDEHIVLGMKIFNTFTPKQVGAYTQKYYDANRPKPILYQMFTFTTDILKQDRQAQEDYIKSIVKRKENLQLTELWYCVEHEDTNLHFHVGLGSYKSIPPDAFKQYKKLYGFVQKSKKISINSEGVSDYISKEMESIKLL